jgi:putative phosphoesterase
LLRDEALNALRGCELILHAGDIGGPQVLEGLRAIAPIRAVRGNNDREPWADAVPDADTVVVGGHRVYLLHDIADLDIDPAREGYAAVIYGHSHKPLAEVKGGVLFLNPGSAGPRRFRLPIALARLTVSSTQIKPRLIDLPI